MSRRVLAVVVLVAPVFVVTAPRVWACSCASAGVGTHLVHADAVFTGRVDTEAPTGSLRSSGDAVTWTFTVDRVYKGSAHKRQQLVSARSGPSCGYGFTMGRSYLVFVRHASEGKPEVHEADAGQYVTGLCSGNRPLAQGPVPDLLGSGHAPRSGGAPDGGGSAGQWPGSVLAAAVVLGGLAVATGGVAVVGRRRLGSVFADREGGWRFLRLRR